MPVRPLTPDDADRYVALRREMLADSPWAFAASPEDDAGLDPRIMRERLTELRQAIVGGFADDGTLVGAAGAYLPKHIKMAHRAQVWGVYVASAWRGRGLGERIMTKLLDVAASWPGVTSAGLSVSVRSPGARRLYERVGFVAWGTEPGALKLKDQAFDEVHMVAQLKAKTS